jgi:hypothetical protein
MSLVLFPGLSLADNDIGGKFHWSDGSNPRAWMTIEDHTPSGWPVLAATNEWATEPNIDMYYEFGGCAGSPGRCVDVRLKDMPVPCAGTFDASGGFFHYEFNAANTHYSEDSFIRFNDACGGGNFDNRDRRALACEEIGHSIGLDHADPGLNNVTCMASGDIRQLHEHPRDHDFSMLHNVIYDHNDP